MPKNRMGNKIRLRVNGIVTAQFLLQSITNRGEMCTEDQAIPLFLLRCKLFSVNETIFLVFGTAYSELRAVAGHIMMMVIDRVTVQFCSYSKLPLPIARVGGPKGMFTSHPIQIGF